LEKLQELKQRLRQERPQSWEAMPDIDLYMDQVISYMSRQMIQYNDREMLTSAMVNNYIKDGMLPRAVGKRYSRVHLGFLTAICALKQVLSVRDTGRLIKTERTQQDSKELYAYFLQALDEALSQTADDIDAYPEGEALSRLALDFALRSYANRLACERILDIIDETTPPVEQNKKADRKSGKEHTKTAREEP